MRTVALVTVARSDWGIYRPVLRELAGTPGIAVRVLASGMHLSERFGLTIRLVEEEAAAFGVPVERVPMDIVSDAPVDVAAAMSAGVAGFARSYAARRPDVLLVLGDRFEMFSAVAAAVPFVLPVFHIHGGERTAGAIDDALRHAMTKMSHMHFVSTREYGRRVRQLGEDSWRIVVCGAPALDEFHRLPRPDLAALSAHLNFSLERPYLLAAFHPTTLEPGAAADQGDAFLAGLAGAEMPVLFMMPNADPGGLVLRQMIQRACAEHADWHFVENLAFEEYAAVMRSSVAMVGNSSSGIIEAPYFRVPVVNIGKRQEGRVRAANVIDVDNDAQEVSAALQFAMSEAMKSRLAELRHPYDAGGAATVIKDVVATVPLDGSLTQKGFVDLPSAGRRREPADFIVAPHASIRDVVACVDRNRTGIAVVVNERGSIVDVVTDGDVRRALVAGGDLAMPISSILGRRLVSTYPVPVVANVGSSDDELLHTMIERKVRQIPIVDRNGKIIDLVVLEDLVAGKTLAPVRYDVKYSKGVA